MKKTLLTFSAFCLIAVMTGCGSAGNALLGNLAQNPSSMQAASSTQTSAPAASTTTSGGESGLTSLLESVLGAVLGGSNTFTQKDLVGTWNYLSADCVFETENFLMKAGGEMAAAQVETKINNALAKIGIQQGSCSFVFNNDNTYTAYISGYEINGTYQLDTENKKLTMTYLSGLATMTPNIVKTGTKISLLFNADKLLNTVTTAAAMTGNASLQSLSSLATSYDGLMIGLELGK